MCSGILLTFQGRTEKNKIKSGCTNRESGATVHTTKGHGLGSDTEMLGMCAPPSSVQPLDIYWVRLNATSWVRGQGY